MALGLWCPCSTKSPIFWHYNVLETSTTSKHYADIVFNLSAARRRRRRAARKHQEAPGKLLGVSLPGGKKKASSRNIKVFRF